MRRLLFVLTSVALASALPGAWRAWSRASAERWSESGDGVLFWLTWAGDPGGRRLILAAALAVAIAIAARLLHDSRARPVILGQRVVRALGHPVALAAALVLALLPHGMAPLRRPDPGDRPSIVLILLDTVRLDHVGWGGSELDTTPGLDALAARGAAFTQAIAQSSWTKPSTATLLTGLTPTRTRATSRFGPLPPGMRTLAEACAGAGYRTAGFSSNPNVTRAFGFDQGFLHWREDVEARAETLVGEARHWLDKAGDEPFLLYLHLNDAHYPYEAPAAYRGRFNHTGIEVRLDGAAEHEFRESGGQTFAAQEVEAMRLDYAEEIRYLDDQVGALVQEMLGARDDLVVAIVSDHGEEFLDHGDLGHAHTLYDELIRVPLQFAWSEALGAELGFAPGVRHEQVRVMDVMPTLLEAARLPWPEAATPMNGSSLGDSLRGADVEHRNAFAETDALGSPLSGPPGPQRALRTPAWKLVITDPWYEPTAGRTWLFHLAADPSESHNVALEREEKRESLRARLHENGHLIERDLSALYDVQVSPERMAELAALGYADVDPTGMLKRKPTFVERAVPWAEDQASAGGGDR